MAAASAKLEELLDILRRHGSLAWSVKHDERGALLLAKAVALALRTDTQSSNEAVPEIRASECTLPDEAGERDKCGFQSEESAGVKVEELRVQVALEVLQGGILMHLKEVQDKSQLGALSVAASLALQEVLLRGGFEAGARYWTALLKGLEVPQDVSTLTTTEITPEAKTFQQQAELFLNMLQTLLKAPVLQKADSAVTDINLSKFLGSLENVHLDTILACTAFYSVDLGPGSLPPWTNSKLAQKAEDIVVLIGTASLNRQTAAVANIIDKQDKIRPEQPESSSIEALQTVQKVHLKRLEGLLSKLHPVLKRKADGAEETSFQVNKELPPGATTVAAHQLSVIVCSLNFPKLGPVFSKVMPSVLTAVDHWSPPVKKQGLLVVSHIVQNATLAELSWFREVLMDALCKCATGSDEEVWPVVLPALIRTTLRLGGKDPRDEWYSHVFLLLLRDMELHYTDVPRRLLWLSQVPSLVDAIKLFVVAHFKRLMPLLLTWIRASDAETRIRTLDLLKLVTLNTWPRMPAHAERLTRELRSASEDNTAGQKHEEERRKIEEACELLGRCKTCPLPAHTMEQGKAKQVQILGS